MSGGKVVVVTGGSRGIGKGIAVATSKAGWTTYITGRSLDTLKEAAKDIANQSGNDNVIPLPCDHKDDKQVQKAIETVISKHGHIDILVNNAYGAVESITAYQKHTPFWEKPLDVWDASHAVGLRSHYVASALVAKHMVQRKQGLIINISSPGGYTYLFDIAYGVGKTGLDRLTADTAHELQRYNVHVVSLWPGAVETETVKKDILENPRANPKSKQMFADAESCEFSGKCVVALAQDPTGTALVSGKVISTVEIARKYNFTDINGRLPGVPFATAIRKALRGPPKQWEPPAPEWFAKL